MFSIALITFSKTRTSATRRDRPGTIRLEGAGAARHAEDTANPVLKYFLGVVRWTRRDLVGLDRATRKVMRVCKT